MRWRDALIALSPLHSATTAKAATNGGAATAVVGWFTVNEWCGLIGVALAAIGLYGQTKARKADQARKAEAHALDMRIRAARLRQLGSRADDDMTDEELHQLGVVESRARD